MRNVRELRDYVEGIETQNSLEAHSFDESSDGKDGAVPAILKEAPVIGDGKFKLEIGRTSSAEEASAISPPPVATEVAQSIPHLNTLGSSAFSAPNPNTTLSLFLTSMQLDWNHGSYEVAATLMAGIKCSEDRPGERGARSEWVWEAWRDWIFCKGSEFWGMPRFVHQGCNHSQHVQNAPCPLSQAYWRTQESPPLTPSSSASKYILQLDHMSVQGLMSSIFRLTQDFF